MEIRDQKICLRLSGVALVAFVVVFATFPGFLPPMSPTMSAQAVADFYREHLGSIRGSMLALNLFEVMFLPLYALIMVQLLRIRSLGPALAFSYLAASAGGITFLALADLGWLIAAFRPYRSPELIQMFNDFGWFAFTIPVGMTIVQCLLVATCVLLDRDARPVFPRWVAWFNVVVALFVAPGALAARFDTGPFAWDGALAFWGNQGARLVYVVVMLVVLRGAIERQAREAASVSTSSSPVRAAGVAG